MVPSTLALLAKARLVCPGLGLSLSLQEKPERMLRAGPVRVQSCKCGIEAKQSGNAG